VISSTGTLTRSATASPLHALVGPRGGRRCAGTERLLHLPVGGDRPGEHANIELIAEERPLRLDVQAAADTYSALANPDVFLMLTDQFGWSAEDYRNWLADSVVRLLL
jgi:hypothetical protein